MKHFTSLLFVLFLTACSSSNLDVAQKPILTLERQVLTRQIVDDLFNSYKSYSHNVFTDLISDDYLPSKLSFINNVEKNLADNFVVSLEITSFFAITSKHKLVAKITWEKKVQDRDTVGQQLLSGSAHLIFRQENNNWKLYRIKGNNPF